MNSFKYILIILLAFPALNACAQEIRVHDPVMIKQNDTYYLFCTGRGISIFSSPDMKNWEKEEPVFDAPPPWAVEAVPTFKGHIWAPDISFHNGKYYLYYSVSAFGKNTSCIGLATNNTLDPDDPDYKWIDHGKVIQSVPGRDLWNAIDPNLVVDENNVPWLTFGSFWSGMKLVKLDENLKAIAEPQEWHTVSKRERSFKTPDEKAGEGAVEAPFIFKKNGYYYLFVSFDVCCRGPESTYKVMVGRSQNITGPYLDKDGIRMDEGGGTLVVKGNENYFGVGHNAAYTFDGKDYLVFHGYSAANEGKPELVIREITWDNESWPVVSLDE
jgi:arabinan endo-1,5-alpha-L-arabinosidase